MLDSQESGTLDFASATAFSLSPAGAESFHHAYVFELISRWIELQFASTE